MSLALRNDSAIILTVDQIFQRKVVEFQTQFSHQTGNSPSGGELNLVVSFGSERISEVNRSVFGIGVNAGLQVFGVEVSGLSYFANRTNEVFFAENGTRFGAQFAADNIFVQAVVPLNDHFFYGGFGAFNHAEFQIHGIVFDIDLNGVDVREQITVILIKVDGGIVVRR